MRLLFAVASFARLIAGQEAVLPTDLLLETTAAVSSGTVEVETSPAARLATTTSLPVRNASAVTFSSVNGSSTEMEFDARSIDNDARMIAERKFYSIMAMAYAKVTTQWTYTEFIQRISSYGCHCFTMHAKAVGGKGQAVDDIDSACQWLYRCHRCVDMDFPNSCDPSHGKYQYTIGANKEISCAGNRDCKLAQCTCDAEFARRMANKWNDINWDSFFWGSRNNPDKNTPGKVYVYADTCKPGTNNFEPDACCGDDYPKRFPYASAERSCCVGASKLYNPAVQECCPDNTVKVSC